jgi:hypothetical protein
VGEEHRVEDKAVTLTIVVAIIMASVAPLPAKAIMAVPNVNIDISGAWPPNDMKRRSLNLSCLGALRLVAIFAEASWACVKLNP